MSDIGSGGDASIPVEPRGAARFDASYEDTPPWDIGHPQPAFAALARSGLLVGRVLDIGCGTGEHALMAAALGLDATGIDAAPTAIRLAEQKAVERDLVVRFAVEDALALGDRSSRYDTVLDCGLFHVFDDHDRADFVASLREVVVSGGWYFMLCFSDQEPGDWGPRRVSRAEIESSFADGWRIESIEESRLEITWNVEGVRAWLVAITREPRVAADGVMARSERTSRPTAAGRKRPRATASVADLISDQRR
jgi:SAM-dependent methyltransferase